VTPTLNIAALTQRTGVPSDTIRKWEQRYGVLRPERTKGGQRRYTELDVARVEWLKARLAEGFRIGEAAALLGNAEVAGGTPDELRAAIIDATVRIDVGALRSAIGQSLLLDSLEVTFAAVLSPALVEIGELWAAGDVTVAQEHLASGAIRASLLRLLADQRGNVRGSAVLACAPGEWHEVGLLMLAILLRADGWQVAYLGPNTPVADAVALARGLGASEVMFSATRDEALASLRTGLDDVSVPEEIDVVVGGSATDRRAAAETVAALR
jgi:methanogenic corrinoid protein MtbC1